MDVVGEEEGTDKGKDKQKPKKRLLTVDDTVAWHKQELDFIKQEIEASKAKGQRTIPRF